MADGIQCAKMAWIGLEKLANRKLDIYQSKHTNTDINACVFWNFIHTNVIVFSDFHKSKWKSGNYRDHSYQKFHMLHPSKYDSLTHVRITQKEEIYSIYEPNVLSLDAVSLEQTYSRHQNFIFEMKLNEGNVTNIYELLVVIDLDPIAGRTS